ncbi:virulence-associated E family protein [uncultured Paludibaculum sp.]|uniref:virulence-associated E family protein n=1 Tax=uncultured Paludibaculum sp. TaxID=1765020 RepID=UPI002AAA6A5F|nr:virulence-associated E family protein [uncultured Paludibaculum sp.]
MTEQTPEAKSAKRKGWTKFLKLGRDGRAKPIFFNAELALRESPDFQGVLAYDEFRMRVVAKRSPPWGDSLGPRWTDDHDRQALRWLQSRGIDVGEAIAVSAVQSVAVHHKFHPLREYLESLVWDERPRLQDWLFMYLGVEHSPYSAAVAERWLVSAVARVFRPGCKSDCCPILEGPQGLGKSTALSILGGEFYTDELDDMGSKDSSLQLLGAWIIELAELSSYSRSGVDRVKAFMSRTTDRFRPPYGRRVIEAPRQCVFGGTVNSDTYLRDETGGRRFWPVVCTKAHLEELRRDRDQLWAEAVVRYRAGSAWWLDTPELRYLAGEEQRARYEGDAWEELIMPWISGRLLKEVSIGQILQDEDCLNKPSGQWTQSDKIRIAKILKSNGWVRFNAAIGGGSDWRYRPVSGDSFQSVSSSVSSPVSSLNPLES